MVRRRLAALTVTPMRHVCLIVHDLNPSSGSGWDFAEAAVRAGAQVEILHTAEIGPEFREALVVHARALGVSYRPLSEVAPAPDVPVFPAVEAHRIGLLAARALAVLEPSAAWFIGQPARTAASVEARATGAGPRACRLVQVVSELAEMAREDASRFAAGGRTDVATDFLERRAVEGVDDLVVMSEPVERWLRGSGWSLPGSDIRRGSDGCERLIEAPILPPAGRRPRISVCLPFHEQPAFLEEALGFLAAQSQPADEVVVIDDGSSSPEAAAAWVRARTRFARPGWVFLREENRGPSAARNRAAREATGEALVFCDADNRFRPGMIAAFAEALAVSGADCVTCAFRAFREPPTEGEPAPEAEQADPGYAFYPLGPCLELGLIENDLGDTNFCVRREVFLALGGFPSDNGAASEDWEFLLRLVLAGRRLATRPEILFDYRIAAGSHARRHSEFQSARLAVRPLLDGAAPLWRKLWTHLAGLIRDPRADRLESQLAPARRDLARLAAENQTLTRSAEAARADGARLLAEARTLSGVHRGLRAQRVLLQDSVHRSQTKTAAAQAESVDLRRRLEALTDASNRDRAALSRALGRIARVEASFSWRCTAPLRALRRALIDRRKRHAAPAPPAAPPQPFALAFHLDAPRVWRPQEREVTARGWCFARGPVAIDAVRARVGEREYPGTYGLDRPDLPGVFTEWPRSGKAGFKVEVAVLGLDRSVILEARDEQGRWHPFFENVLGPSAEAPRGSYEHWLHAYDEASPGDREPLRAAAAALPPLTISVLMPVFDPSPRSLERAIESVRAQAYPNWELCVADDASTDPRIAALLERAAREEPRIKLVRRPRNGHISAATNSALALATGAYAALLDHDDELAPHALYCVAAEIAEHPEADLVYSDEDKIDDQGARFDPHFKPDWNPDLLNSQNYISHLAVYRTGRLRELGGLREGFEGSQDWDLALRFTEKLPTERIRHIPRILYHWRAGDGSTALHLGEKSYAADSARRALEEHFVRTGREVVLVRTVGGHWRASYALPAPRPLVSLLIPARNAAELTRLCLASVIARTRYAPYEIVLIDNGSDDPRTLAFFEEASREDGVRVVRYDGPFNYSAINNFAAGEARGEILCLLNNDMEVLEPAWLDEMAGHALRPEIGAVGARLYYPDFRIQHAGVITGLGG
ncbi:MAG: glycosyltransferase, partial [Opitutaceae bacterium]